MAYTIPNAEDITGSFAQYLGKFGLTGNYLNPAQNWLKRQYDPLQLMYNLQGRLATSPNSMAAPGKWGDWVGSQMGSYLPETPAWAANQVTQNPAEIARYLLGNIFRSGLETRQATGTTYEPDINEAGQAVSGRGGSLGELQDLILMALKPRLGYQGANFVAGRAPDVRDQWLGLQAQGQSPGSFLEYLQSKYGLQRFV